MCNIKKKANDPILRKLSHGQTDRQIDGQTDKSDFIGRSPTNVERPIKEQQTGEKKLSLYVSTKSFQYKQCLCILTLPKCKDLHNLQTRRKKLK